MKNYLPVFAAAALIGISGCSSIPENTPKMKMALGVPDGMVKYDPISANGLVLRWVGKKEAYAGTKTSLIFTLTNNSGKQVSIPEWYSCETDNVVIYIQPWLNGMKEPVRDGWIKLSFDLRQPILHYPLQLMPGNQVMVEKKLDFVEKLHVSPGKERRYFVKASLNLKSLKLNSEVSVLRILPKKQGAAK